MNQVVNGFVSIHANIHNSYWQLLKKLFAMFLWIIKTLLINASNQTNLQHISYTIINSNHLNDFITYTLMCFESAQKWIKRKFFSCWDIGLLFKIFTISFINFKPINILHFYFQQISTPLSLLRLLCIIFIGQVMLVCHFFISINL